jgi:prepilin-type N-terminal cleavage/methylation domain-containing protein
MVATRRRQPVRSRADGGYSLPELLVVILILGILAAISTALYLSQRQRGYEAQLTADLRNAVVQVESDAAMNGGAYPSEAPAFTTSDATVSLVYAASGEGAPHPPAGLPPPRAPRAGRRRRTAARLPGLLAPAVLSGPTASGL